MKNSNQDYSEENSRDNTNRAMKQNSESIYSDPYPVREAYSQPESPNRYGQTDMID